jgi:hypothetical protein
MANDKVKNRGKPKTEETEVVSEKFGITDSKKINSTAVRTPNSVYGVDDKNVKDFHNIGAFRYKQLGNRTVVELIEELNAEIVSLKEKIVVIKEVLEYQDKEINEMKGELDKYGMV